MDAAFWNNKKVLITGHTGFKGSWLSLWLQRAGARVVGFSLSPLTDPNLFEAAHIAEGMTSITGDIRDLDALAKVLNEHRPEIVIHMAAQALVRPSYAFPVDTYSTNIMGTVNLLESVRNADCVKVLINVTSDKCYENKEWLWGYRENDPMGGHDPYSSSKGCAELVTAAYRKSYFDRSGTAVATGRAGNVIGGGDWARDRLVPDIVTALAGERPVIIRNPGAVRPWQHVLDPLNGYLVLAEKLWTTRGEFCGAWNFGPSDNDVRQVSWLVERVKSCWGGEVEVQMDHSLNPHEAHYLKLDCSKAKALLGWIPRLALSPAVEWTVEWYKQYYDSRNARQITENQISRFQELGQ